MIPCVHEVHETAGGYLGVKALYEIGALRRYAPVALAGVAASAQVAAHGKQRGGCDINRVGAERYRLYDVCAGTDRTADDDGNVVSYALVAQALIDARKRKLDRNADVIPYSCGSRARTAAEAA